MKRQKKNNNHSPTAKKGFKAELIPSEEGSFLEQPIQHIQQNDPDSDAGLDQSERTKRNKERFIKAYTASLLTINKACEAIKIDRSTYYDWIKNDPEFKKAVIDAEECQAQLAEHELLRLMQMGDGPSIRYYLDRRVKRYHPKQVLEHHVGDKTLEDLLDEDKANDNAEDTLTTDRGTAKNPGQTETDSAVPLERGATVLLGSQDPAQSDPESSPEGAN